MKTTSWASAFFRNRHALVLAIVAVLVGGMSSIASLPRLEDPRITNRDPIIITRVPGASAERVETLVTEPLEKALQEIVDIKDIESTSTRGVSLVRVKLKATIDATNNKSVFAEIRDKVEEARQHFPPQAQAPEVDDKRDPAAFTLITAVTWAAAGAPNLNIMNRAAEELATRLRSIPGTELVRLYGAPDEEITVTADPVAIADLGLSAEDLSHTLRSADAKRAAGVLRADQTNVTLEVRGELDSVARIQSIPVISDSQLGIVRIGDIASVERNWRSPASDIAYNNGQRVILVAARMDSQLHIDAWANSAQSLIDAYAIELGSGLQLDPVFEQASYTHNQLTNLVSNLIAGVLVVMAVVMLTMGWRLALVIGIAIPLVVSMVLLGWQFTGNAIQQMSIFGLIIALGLLIDNAIVAADEVARHKQNGLSSLEALERAVHHLAIPLFASTLTTVLAFAPILLLTGSVGEFVGSIGGTVIIALSCSLVVALSVVAALAALFARSPGADGKRWWHTGVRLPMLQRRYRQALEGALRRPLAAIAFALFLPVSGFIAATQLGNQFFPPVDRDMFELKMWLPNNSSIDHTADQALTIEDEVRKFDAVTDVHWRVGGSYPSVFYNLAMSKEFSPYYAHAIIKADSAESARAIIKPMQIALNARFPNAQLVLRQFGQGPPIEADVEYRLYGPSLETLQTLGEQVRLALQSDPDVMHTRTSIPRGEPKLWFSADEDEALLAGLKLTDIASQLESNLEGSIGGTVLENLEQLPVRVRYGADYRASSDDIASMQIVSKGLDEWTSLQALGTLELRPELGGNTRFNSLRTNRIEGYTVNGALPIDVTRRVLETLEASGFFLPAGYRIEIGGAVEEDREATASLLAYVPLLLTLTVATLVLLFRSATLAGLLGLVGFLSVGPGLLATWAMGFPISFNTILGTLGLVGLAFNNSIVVLAAIRSQAPAREGDASAIVESIAGASRHIFSTTLTTVGGFLPLILFVGGDFWPSLSIVLAGGVFGSTILALVFTPTMYALGCRWKHARARREQEHEAQPEGAAATS